MSNTTVLPGGQESESLESFRARPRKFIRRNIPPAVGPELPGRHLSDEEELAEVERARKVGELAGGTTEMARNGVAERVLGMPRERTLDRDVPFRDVPKGPPGRQPSRA